MYMRMITYHVMPDVEHGQSEQMYEDVVRFLKEQEGFEGSSLLLNEDASVAIVMTYWDDETCAGIAGEKVLPILFECSAHLSEGPPEISGFHVLDHHLTNDPLTNS
jgi:hypothetical protein